MAFLLAVVAGWFLGAGEALPGALLAQAASIADGVDGELARLQVRAGPGGALLDGVLDRIADATVLGGLAVWALSEGPWSAEAVIGLTVAATTGSMLSMASKDRVAALALPPAPEQAIGYLLGGRDGRLLLVAVFALFHRPLDALLAVAVSSSLSLILRLLSVARQARLL